MKAYFIPSVTIVDPTSSHHNKTVSLHLKEGVIADILPPNSSAPASTEVVTFSEGSCVSPGWLDLCVHLNDPGYEWKEDIDSLARAAALGGFTDILCYPNTHPVMDNAHLIQGVRRRTQHYPTHFWFCGAITEKAEGKQLAELYDMAQAGAVAFTDGLSPVSHAGVLKRALEYCQAFGGRLISMPMDRDMMGEGQVNEGNTSLSLGMKGIPEIAETLSAIKDLALLSYTGGRMHFQPVSSAEVIKNIFQKREEGFEVSSAVAIPHLVLSDEVLVEFDSLYKLLPPLRSQQQQEDLVKMVQQGYVQAICSGHQAQGMEEKNNEFSISEFGMLNLQTTFSLAMTHLVAKKLLSMDQLISLLSHGPREVLGFPVHAVEEQAEIGLSFFHPTERWTLKEEDIPSRARNTPFLGHTFTGRVKGVYAKQVLEINT